MATVTRPRAKTIDDALHLLDLLMVTELAGKAHQHTSKATIRRWARFAKASSRLAAAVETMLEAAEWGEDPPVSEVLEMIDAIVARPDPHAAVAEVTATVPPPDADDDGGWRQEMAAHTQRLDQTYRGVGARLEANTAVSIDTDGRVHVAAIKAIEEPASLLELRKRVAAMMRGWTSPRPSWKSWAGTRRFWTR